MMQRFQAAGIVVCGGALGMLSLAAFVTGCQMDRERLNAPPQGATERPHELQEPFAAMSDNALLEDMSMSAVHFVPRQAELNGTGVRRLKRMAPLLKVYGGKVYYTGFQDSRDLVQRRMEQIEEYLLAEGVEDETFEVVLGQAGGDGMDASEAIAIRHGSRYGQQSAGSGACTGTLGGQ